MNGIAILRHGLDMLLRNLGPALRVSLVPYLLGLLPMGLLWTTGALPDPDSPEGLGGALPGLLLALLVALVTWAWLAVAWHRYILLEERPDLVPPLRPSLVWSYLRGIVLLALIMLPVLIALGVLFGLLSLATLGLNGAGGVPTTAAIPVLLGWLWTRISLILPARAVERPMPVHVAWATSAPASGAILLATAVLAGAYALLGAIPTLILGEGIASAVLSLALDWFFTMLGLSVLTTLYGTLVEGRSLPR